MKGHHLEAIESLTYGQRLTDVTYVFTGGKRCPPAPYGVMAREAYNLHVMEKYGRKWDNAVGNVEVAKCTDDVRMIDFGIGEISWGMVPKKYLFAVTLFDKENE